MGILFISELLCAQPDSPSIHVPSSSVTQYDKGLPHQIIEVGGGPTFMYPNFLKWLAENITKSHMDYHNVRNWKLSYSYLFSKGFGFGIDYMGIHADYRKGTERKSGSISMNYFAPTFNGHLMIKKWMLQFEIGAGCKMYNEGDIHSSYFAVNTGMGAEYKLSQRLGLFLEYNSISSFCNPELSRDFPISLTGGVCCYF